MNILLVDDHAIVRAGLRRLLLASLEVEIQEAATGREALALFRQYRPALVILDLNLPGIGGLELLRRIVLEDPAARVLVFSMHAEAMYAGRALQAGARGYASKNASPEELTIAVRRILDGGRYIESEIAQEMALQNLGGADPLHQLTERDLEVLRLLAEGSSLSEIADALGVGYKTIANTCTQIKAKLGVARTADLIRISIEMGVT